VDSYPDNTHSVSIEDTFRLLQTSTHGLNLEEVAKRQQKYGKNILQEATTSAIEILFRQFNSVLVYILFTASLVSLLLAEWTDFFVINGILLINGLVGFWQELKAEASIDALKKLTESKNRVIRDGKSVSIASTELVPGDYVIFHEGEAVTADMRLTDSSGLMVDESSLTGESVPIVKDHTLILPQNSLPYEWANMLLAGTVVVRGSGHGVVEKTGTRTYLNSIAEKATEASPETPLGKALKFFSRNYLVLVVCIFFLLGIAGLIQGRDIIGLGYILLAGLVSAVPAGLPIVLTLVMVVGAMALSRKKTLIRYLPSVETLGSVTVIASDKTGTITEGKLIIKEIYSKDEQALKMIAALCNDAHGESGDPLDVALSKWLADEYDHIRETHPRIWTHSFDARLRLMATVNQVNKTEELFVKGAFEALKAKSEHSEEWDAIFDSFVQQGLRVITFGMGIWEHNTDPNTWKIRLIGLCGFIDPAKKEVVGAVRSAKSAGVRVLMITGDHPTTAKVIAQDVGIWSEGDEVLVGKEIEELSDQALLEALKKTTVLARILPEHKYRLVKLLQKAKEIVAVTGDGVNDVPALKAADIGIAMGGGTEAAKSVSRMVITDNNLSVIVEAIRNARVIADNIRKVIYYLISTSLMEISLIVFAILSNLPLPLAAIQILWINLVTDGVQDKFFPFAKEEGNVMTRPPRNPRRQFFDKMQIIRIALFSLFVGMACCFLYIYLLDEYPTDVVSTIIFASVVVAQWANGIQSQKETEPFFKNVSRSFTINPLIFSGLGLGLFLQISATYFAPRLLHAIPMQLEHWSYPCLIFLFSFSIVEVRKWMEITWVSWRLKQRSPNTSHSNL
jgi:P-type Ca2+ transporter type 2C